ncbi:YfhO family protein [Chloroflexota bacterium]
MRLRKLFAVLAPIGIIALILLFFTELAFTNLIPARGDAYSYFYPYWHTASTALQTGRLPLWNDLIFTGAPFLANSQVGLLYPPNWPLWLLFDAAPTATKTSILLHLIWAGLGTYVLLRVPLRLSTWAAFSGAALFAIGGQLTAHIEQINQLQGLSWLPWLFFLLMMSRQNVRLYSLLLAGALAVQVLSGHTQTVFISVVGLGVMALWWAIRDTRQQNIIHRLTPLAVIIGAGLFALLLTIPQLLPTMELSSLSNRSGGLTFNEVISFSLHPALVGRAMLPGYDIALHNEYIATIGIAGLALAIIGGWASLKRGAVWQGWLIITLLGLALALGGWTPLYWVLGRLPGFNLFRVPARWLILWALGSSVLVAHAVHLLQTEQIRVPRWLIGGIAIAALLLIAGAFLAPIAAEIYLSGAIQPLPVALFGWLTVTASVIGVLLLLPRRYASVVLVILALGELFFASFKMPYNNLNAPETFAATRPAINTLSARHGASLPMARTLAFTDIMYAPGDQSVVNAVYDGLLPGKAQYDLLVANKLKDVIAPNLNMIWDIPSADGFDGGILPTHNYTLFSELLMDNPPPDGRLRENLTAPPAQRWLDLLNVGYILTDRTGDRWINDIYFDLSWSTPLNNGQIVTLNNLPDFAATGLATVVEAAAAANTTPLANITVQLPDDTRENMLIEFSPIEGTTQDVGQISWAEPAVPQSIQINSRHDDLVMHGAALINDSDNTFHNVTVSSDGDWQLAQLGDIKIYENPIVAPRAFLVHTAEVIADDAAALTKMQQVDFDPLQHIILASGENLDNESGDSTVTITAYSPEHIAFSITTDNDAYLLVTDAYYPGWTAQLNGEPIPIHRADLLFRAVMIPAGEHTLTMTYTPTGWTLALLVGGIAWIGLLLAAGYLFYREMTSSGEPNKS